MAASSSSKKPPSTPPRVRHRAKTMTSASTRPPALRKPRGRSPEKSKSSKDRETKNLKKEDRKVKKDKSKKEEKKEEKKAIKDASEQKQATKDASEPKAIKDASAPKEESKKEKKPKREASAAEPELKKAKKEKKDKEPKIKFKPAKAPEIQHIFHTPERTTRARSPSPPGAPALSSRDKAQKKLQQLTDVLNKENFNDVDSESCPATDLENFAEKADATKPGSESEDSDGEGSEEGQKSEEEQSDEEDVSASAESSESEAEATEDENEDDDETEEESEEGEGADEKERESEKETEKGEGKESKEPTSHALVPVTEATENKVVALRNSMTNKREWDKFCRQAKSKMPNNLSDYYQSSKVELFNMWLDSGKDWQACQVVVERNQEQKNVTQRGWTAIQGKELAKRYSKEKWEVVKQKRKAAGLYYEDEDFPGDDDVTW